MKKIRILALVLCCLLVLSACGGSKGEDRPLSFGALRDGVYTNTYVGIGFQLDDGYEFLGAQDLQDLSADVDTLLQGTELAEAMEDYEQIFVAQITNLEQGNNMGINYVKLQAGERRVYASKTEEQIVDFLLEEQDELVDSYEQMGILVTKMEKKTVTFLGQPHTALYTEATIEGIPVYMLQLADYDNGDYGITITFTSALEDHNQEMMDRCFVLE